MLFLEIMAAIGCAALLWVALGWLLRPKTPLQAVLILPAAGDAPELEQTMRRVRLLRNRGWLSASTLLLDCGLSERGQQIAALLEDEDTRLADPRRLAEYIMLETMEYGDDGAFVWDHPHRGLSE